MANFSPLKKHVFILTLITANLCIGAILLRPLAAQTIHATNKQDEQFLQKTATLAHSLQNKNARRLSPLRSVNSSYENTQKALGLFDTPTASNEVIGLLTKATKQYKGNYIASLFLGVYEYGRGDLERAVPHFQTFMQKSLFPSKIERELISDGQTMYFRKFIETKLTENGYSLESPSLALEYKFKRGLQRLHVFPDESLIGGILSILVFGGIAFMLFNSIAKVFTADTTPLFIRQLSARIYIVLVIAYITWMVHLYLGLQPIIGGSLVREIMYLIMGGVILISAIQFYSYLKEKNEIRNNPDLILCPHCKYAQSKINAICSSCKKRMD